MIRPRTFVTGLVAGLLCAVALAQTHGPLPGETASIRTRTIQDEAEAVYRSGDYPRALDIYRNELAPIGDKYAQYMVGYMYLNGQGVAPDRATALAWYRLATERGQPLLERTRDEIAAEMTPAQRARSDELYRDLWAQMSDRVLLVALMRKDVQILSQQSGTRIPGAAFSGPVVVYDRDGKPLGPNYYRDVRKRLQERMDYLDTRVEIRDDLVADEARRIGQEEAEIRRTLSIIDKR